MSEISTPEVFSTYTFDEVLQDIRAFEKLSDDVSIMDKGELSKRLYSQKYSYVFGNPLDDNKCMGDLKKRIDEYLSVSMIPNVDILPGVSENIDIYIYKLDLNKKDFYNFYIKIENIKINTQQEKKAKEIFHKALEEFIEIAVYIGDGKMGDFIIYTAAPDLRH